MTRLLVDGIVFQNENVRLAKFWELVLNGLAQSGRFKIYLLDRGKSPMIPCVEYIPFPRAHMFAHSAADSFLIQQVCDHYKIDVFTSTYFTSPVHTPMVLMVCDMIPELFELDLRQRPWQEKDTAIAYAQRYLCLSNCSRADLLVFYPEIPKERIVVIYCGVDVERFFPREREEVEAFCVKRGLDSPYFLFSSSLVQVGADQSLQVFFEALSRLRGIEVVSVNAVGVLQDLPSGVNCRSLELADDEIPVAYGGAVALIYAAAYENFGMPVIEAMASGCPVITTSHGALAEIVGNAGCLVSGHCVEEVVGALERVQDPSSGGTLRKEGLIRAREFRWQKAAQVFGDALEMLVHEHRAGAYDEFFNEWKRIRQIQASVDYEC